MDGDDAMTTKQNRDLTYREAVREALRQELSRDPNVVLLGEDIGQYGGVFKVTLGLIDEFGPERVVQTPIAEAGFVGAAIGSAMTGGRPIVELMFMDFSLVAADQMLNQAAKMRFISGDDWKVPLTIRTQQGVGVGTAAQHSQSFEALFAHVPGFAVALPATPADAKGLLSTAIRSDDPCLVIEHKALYSLKGEVPEGEHLVPFGQAAVRREGGDLTIVSYSSTVHTALAAADLLDAIGIGATVIDLRTVMPIDWDTIAEHVSATGRLLVAHEDHRRFGVGAEIATEITARCWNDLEAPVVRICGLDIPVPYAQQLESSWGPQPNDIVTAAQQLMAT
jgi:pyruvate/2-oxoglutarate/acetoin dehydrogenase E1 component